MVLPRSEKSLNNRVWGFGVITGLLVIVSGVLLAKELLFLVVDGADGNGYNSALEGWELRVSLLGNAVLLAILLGSVAMKNARLKYQYYTSVPQGRVIDHTLSTIEDSVRCNVVIEGHNALNELRKETHTVSQEKWRSYQIGDYADFRK